MAKRGTPKHRSVEQEKYVASLYDGIRSPSSGAADTDLGDVRTDIDLIECKTTGGPEEKPTRKPVWVKEFEKIMHEAYSVGKEPALAMRFYLPDSPLADKSGWVDLIIRRLGEDAERAIMVENERTLVRSGYYD